MLPNPGPGSISLRSVFRVLCRVFCVARAPCVVSARRAGPSRRRRRAKPSSDPSRAARAALKKAGARHHRGGGCGGATHFSPPRSLQAPRTPRGRVRGATRGGRSARAPVTHESLSAIGASAPRTRRGFARPPRKRKRNLVRTPAAPYPRNPPRSACARATVGRRACVRTRGCRGAGVRGAGAGRVRQLDASAAPRGQRALPGRTAPSSGFALRIPGDRVTRRGRSTEQPQNQKRCCGCAGHRTAAPAAAWTRAGYGPRGCIAWACVGRGAVA